MELLLNQSYSLLNLNNWVFFGSNEVPEDINLPSLSLLCGHSCGLKSVVPGGKLVPMQQVLIC